MNKQFINKHKTELTHISDNMLILYALGDSNPGAYTVVSKLYEILEQNETNNEKVIAFITNLLELNICGARLWYIFKNEATTDVNKLITLDLTNFTDEYFYDRFEKYI